ncbi:MAG: nucleotidyl transferase AbiEii/AbiGii toxin family protein [Deltaproteobacteria bacterium]|nr:nucleotidyl transferase AbiEii/AbiGii toxin family protein [Deltaproteobacteria bacterium]
MSHRILQERLDTHRCQSHQEEAQALREIVQEIALAALSRSAFFKVAAFHGGTALRILYSLERFSEDLDFALHQPNPTFAWETYLRGLITEFAAYGLTVEIEDRTKATGTVKAAFLKDQSIGKVLKIRHPLTTGRPKQIRVKFELDTNPPTGAHTEIKYLDFPFPFPVVIHDLPSLFAGKCHALLCREYLKGRDWYDFVWYVGRHPQLNMPLLSAACEQQGPWRGQGQQVTRKWFLDTMRAKIRATDWAAARADVERFLKPTALSTLALWSTDFFLDRLDRLAEGLR